jgi:ferric-dicitrate binding protein FerR (iron transport regulator)
MKVKPAEGRAVRDERTMQLLPPEGRDVPNSAYWQRRLRDGDVVAADGGQQPHAAHQSPEHRRAVPRVEEKGE